MNGSDTDEPSESTLVRSPVLRGLWMLAGFGGVAVGGLGVVLPGLPTVGPFIFAAWCFSKSSPRFEAWILDLRGIGPMVRDYRSGLGMPRRAKVTAVSMMWLAIALSAGLLIDPIWLRLVIVALGVVGTWWIVIRTPTAATTSRSPG